MSHQNDTDRSLNQSGDMGAGHSYERRRGSKKHKAVVFAEDQANYLSFLTPETLARYMEYRCDAE